MRRARRRNQPEDRMRNSLALLKLVAHGEEASRAGKTAPHREVFERLARKHGLNVRPR